MPTYIISYHSTVILIPIYQYLIVKSCFFYIWNHIGIRLLYKALQLKKVYKIEPA